MGGIGSKLEEIQEFEQAQQEMEKQEVGFLIIFIAGSYQGKGNVILANNSKWKFPHNPLPLIPLLAHFPSVIPGWIASRPWYLQFLYC